MPWEETVGQTDNLGRSRSLLGLLVMTTYVPMRQLYSERKYSSGWAKGQIRHTASFQRSVLCSPGQVTLYLCSSPFPVKASSWRWRQNCKTAHRLVSSTPSKGRRDMKVLGSLYNPFSLCWMLFLCRVICRAISISYFSCSSEVNNIYQWNIKRWRRTH